MAASFRPARGGVGVGLALVPRVATDVSPAGCRPTIFSCAFAGYCCLCISSQVYYRYEVSGIAVQVSAVEPGSVADKAGLLVRDELLRLSTRPGQNGAWRPIALPDGSGPEELEALQAGLAAVPLLDEVRWTLSRLVPVDEDELNDGGRQLGHVQPRTLTVAEKLGRSSTFGAHKLWPAAEVIPLPGPLSERRYPHFSPDAWLYV